jgi:hypothetical protein
VDFQAIWQRVQRAVKREDGVYAEIGADSAATVQAIVVVGIASLISARLRRRQLTASPRA